MMMMRKAGVDAAIYQAQHLRRRWSRCFTSTYAIYASGKDAVLGGMIAMALTFVIYGFLAPRFPPPVVVDQARTA